MAAALKFRLNGAKYEAVLVKLERKNLYGWTDLVAVDADVQELPIIPSSFGQVKERISAHIEVDKAGTGYSTLTGPSFMSIAASAPEAKKKGGRKKKDPQP